VSGNLRHLVHPGPVTPERRESLTDANGRAVRFALRPGESLADGLSRGVAALGARCAAFTLHGGSFARLDYCIAAPNPEGPQVARYSAPIPAGPVLVLGGGGALGIALDGSPLVHCHALLAGADGAVFGGHLLPAASLAGEDPPIVHARAYSDVAVRQRPDPETAMSIFHPAPASQ
jgi:predicted DNA-binding protein with PD1-like motif